MRDMKAYSQDLRDRVIDLYERYKYTKIALSKLFKLDRHTISDWIKRYKETGDYSSKQHCQTGRQIRFSDKEKVLAYLAENPDAEGKEIRDCLAPNLPISTFYDALSRMKITYKKRAKISGERRRSKTSLYREDRSNRIREVSIL